MVSRTKFDIATLADIANHLDESTDEIGQQLSDGDKCLCDENAFVFVNEHHQYQKENDQDEGRHIRT